MNARSRAWALLASAALVTSLSACGGSDETTDTQGQGAATPSTSAPAAGPSASASSVSLTTSSTSLGEFLVDGEGMTVYLFTEDTPGSGKSTCEGGCLQAWPAVEGPATAGDGVDADELDSLTRSDGSLQATYHGWPLYYWVQDTKAGDTTGQGVEDVWYVISPGGEAIGR